MTKACPKCGYARQAGDASPDYECPSCGVIYEKYVQHMANKAAREADELRARQASERREADRQHEEAAQANAEAAKVRSQARAVEVLATEAREVQAAAQQAAARVMPCPDCRGTVSRMAPACPHCGSPFFEAVQAVDASVVDIRMPFMSMVAFMVKWVVASIPAAIILLVLAMVAVLVFGGVVSNMLR